MEQRVLARLTKDFQVGSEDWNDVAFTEQRIRWTQDSQNGPYSEVSQDKAIDELEEIPVERNAQTPSMHTNVQKFAGTEKLACRVGHSSNAAAQFPDVLRWLLLQQLAM